MIVCLLHIPLVDQAPGLLALRARSDNARTHPVAVRGRRPPPLEAADTMPDGRQTALSPDQAVDRLEAMHAEAVQAQRDALARFAAGGAPPEPEERRRFRYPELRLVWKPSGPTPVTRRAWGKFQAPGAYATTVTQPGFFRPYLLEQLRPLVAEYGASIQVRRQRPGDALSLRARARRRTRTQRRLAGRAGTTFPRHPYCRQLAMRSRTDCGPSEQGQPRPLALFDAVRVDYSLRRLLHYTGADWRSIQPWILLTNYQRYVDQFVCWGLDELATAAQPLRPSDRPRRGLRQPQRRPERGRGAACRRALAPFPDARLSPRPRRWARAA